MMGLNSPENCYCFFIFHLFAWGKLKTVRYSHYCNSQEQAQELSRVHDNVPHWHSIVAWCQYATKYEWLFTGQRGRGMPQRSLSHVDRGTMPAWTCVLARCTLSLFQDISDTTNFLRVFCFFQRGLFFKDLSYPFGHTSDDRGHYVERGRERKAGTRRPHHDPKRGPVSPTSFRRRISSTQVYS